MAFCIIPLTALLTRIGMNLNMTSWKSDHIIKTCMPLKRVKFDKHERKKSNWITAGLIRSIKFRDKLHLKMKQTPTHSEAYANIKINLRTYNKMLKRNIEQAKIMYYHHNYHQRRGWNISNYIKTH